MDEGVDEVGAVVVAAAAVVDLDEVDSMGTAITIAIPTAAATTSNVQEIEATTLLLKSTMLPLPSCSQARAIPACLNCATR